MSLLTEAERSQFNGFLSHFEASDSAAASVPSWTAPPMPHPQAAGADDAYARWDAERKQRMAHQARELADWMASQAGQPLAQPSPTFSNGHGHGQLDFHNQHQQHHHPQAHRSNGGMEAGPSAPKRAKYADSNGAAPPPLPTASPPKRTARKRVSSSPEQARGATGGMMSSSSSAQTLQGNGSDARRTIATTSDLSTRASMVPRARPAPRPAASTSARTATTAAPAEKPALLTAAQKKANHIASEQKRRAAIRAGYDGLCNLVPELRSAEQEPEEPAAKGRRKKKKADGGDGRAGPRSEAVVLSKSVNYLSQLVSHRSALVGELQRVYAALDARASGGGRARPFEKAAPEWDMPWEGDGDGEGLEE